MKTPTVFAEDFEVANRRFFYSAADKELGIEIAKALTLHFLEEVEKRVMHMSDYLERQERLQQIRKELEG